MRKANIPQFKANMFNFKHGRGTVGFNVTIHMYNTCFTLSRIEALNSLIAAFTYAKALYPERHMHLFKSAPSGLLTCLMVST